MDSKGKVVKKVVKKVNHTQAKSVKKTVVKPKVRTATPHNKAHKGASTKSVKRSGKKVTAKIETGRPQMGNPAKIWKRFGM